MAEVDQGVLYDSIINYIFREHWREGVTQFEFRRTEINATADALKLERPGNAGDVVYKYRFRRPFPAEILATQSKDLEWVLELAGRGIYRFRLVRATRIEPRCDLVRIAIPDATPEVIRAYALDDEQALLAIIRYNRLMDTFLGLTTYSLQNHLRTTVKGIGQIEVDELYVGIDTEGRHYVIPVQAKGGRDQIGIVQISQDISFVEEKFPGIRCRAVAAQFMPDDVVALFELTLQDGQVRVAAERHYKLVPASELDPEAIRMYE